MLTWNQVHVKIVESCTHDMYLKLSCQQDTNIISCVHDIKKSLCQPGTKFMSRLSNHVTMIFVWNYHVNMYMNMISCVHWWYKICEHVDMTCIMLLLTWSCTTKIHVHETHHVSLRRHVMCALCVCGSHKLRFMLVSLQLFKDTYVTWSHVWGKIYKCEKTWGSPQGDLLLVYLHFWGWSETQVSVPWLD